MKAKTCLITILMATIIISSGCLDSKGEIKSGQVQVNEFKWTEFNGRGANFQMVINSDYDGNAPITVYIGIERVSVGNQALMKGENLISGRLDLLNVYGSDSVIVSSHLRNKEKGQMIIKAMDWYYSSEVSKNPDDYTTIYSKVIDMPYANFEIKPSSSVIGKDGGYLTITNLGNIKEYLLITTDRRCGISFQYSPEVRVNIAPQESKQIPVELDTTGMATAIAGGCKLESGESGNTNLRINSLYPTGLDEPIYLGETDVRYKNQ